MAKITLSDILGSFASVVGINSRLQQVEDELNNKVLYRDNPIGEDNAMQNDIDMNGNSIVNIASVSFIDSPNFLSETELTADNWTIGGDWNFTGNTTLNGVSLATTSDVSSVVTGYTQAANAETISGNWNFTGTPTKGGINLATVDDISSAAGASVSKYRKIDTTLQHWQTTTGGPGAGLVFSFLNADTWYEIDIELWFYVSSSHVTTPGELAVDMFPDTAIFYDNTIAYSPTNFHFSGQWYGEKSNKTSIVTSSEQIGGSAAPTALDITVDVGTNGGFEGYLFKGKVMAKTGSNPAATPFMQLRQVTASLSSSSVVRTLVRYTELNPSNITHTLTL